MTYEPSLRDWMPSHLPAFRKVIQDASRDVLARIGDTANIFWQPDSDNHPQQLAYDLAEQVDIMGYGGKVLPQHFFSP